jgi:hypothetical protein
MTKTKSLQAHRLASTRLRSSQSPPSSPPSQRQADLAALEAHFLASFAGADFEQQRRQGIKNGKKRAQEASAAEVHHSVKEVESFQQGKSTASTSIPHPPRRQPVTIVFDEGGSGAGGKGHGSEDAAVDAKKNWKEFMVRIARCSCGEGVCS